MKSREYGTWPPRNGLGPERQKLYDEFNRAFKKERPPQPKEYASSEIEEYYRVPEMKDMSGNPYERNDTAKSGQSKQSKNTQRLRQNILRQVIGVLVGSVIIVTTYQTMAERQRVSAAPAIVETEDQTPDTPSGAELTPGAPSGAEQTENEPVTLFPTWNWSEDKQTVVLMLSDINGNLIKEITATVSVSEIAATCNKEGRKTYTATAKDEDNQYSDTQSETLPPLGHDFGDGQVIVLENGQTAMSFECTRCHEHFTIQTSMTEND